MEIIIGIALVFVIVLIISHGNRIARLEKKFDEFDSHNYLVDK